MKRQDHIRVAFAFGFMLMAMSYTTAEAVSYVPQSVIDQGATDTINHRRQGTVVHLFHGVAPESVRSLVGQEVAVFREAESECPPEKRLVGKIRILRLSGNHHLEVVVIEGDLRDGDVAHLGGVYGLVVPARERCEAVAPNP